MSVASYDPLSSKGRVDINKAMKTFLTSVLHNTYTVEGGRTPGLNFLHCRCCFTSVTYDIQWNVYRDTHT